MKRIIRVTILTAYTLLISVAALEISNEPNNTANAVTVINETNNTIYAGFYSALSEEINNSSTLSIQSNINNLVTSSLEELEEEQDNNKLPDIQEEIPAYIAYDNVELREKPKKDSSSLYTFKKTNTEITYIEYNKDWVQVCYNEEIGYIKISDISENKISEEEIKKRAITCKQAYTCSRFRNLGRVKYGSHTYTWYSQKVLPGGGLKIPGRHVNKNGLVCDKDGYICVAVDFLPKGSIVDTPLGIKGKVYDCGAGYNNIDIYCNW